ncbi:flagellin [Paenibacillus sp. PastF-1]
MYGNIYNNYCRGITMIVTHNLTALNTNNALRKNNKAVADSTAKLSSGMHINQASDDAAGLSISEKMRAQIRGLNQASSNVQGGISVIHTAEGGLQEITDMLQRQRELLIQGSNSTNTDGDKRKIDQEIQQLKDEINSLTSRTDYNTINLLARDDYQILEDRSSHKVEENTTGPFPATTTSYERTTSFFPAGTAEEPANVKSSHTNTTIDDDYTLVSHTTAITSPDGREGFNDYAKNVHTHTETTATSQNSYERLLVSDPRYKELATVSFPGTVKSVFFQTELIPTSISAGQYPDFGGLEDRFISVDIDGVSTSLEGFTLTGSTTTASSISAVYEKDGIQIEKIFSSDPSSFKVEFNVRNLSGIDGRQITVSTGFQPMYDGQYSISSPSGVPVGSTASNAQIPASGTVFTLSNALVDFNFSFLDGGAYAVPESLTTPASGYLTSSKSPSVQITPTWGRTMNDGEALSFGIALNNFNFKKDVYQVTNEATKQVDSIAETVTTDIQDIDYIPPRVQIQSGANENQLFSIPLFDVDTDGLGITGMGILPPSDPELSLQQADSAIAKVSNYRGIYGSLQNRMEHALNNLGSTGDNLTAAESRIRDADMAKEMSGMTRANILSQASQAMMAQANQNPQAILQFLK